MGNLKINKDIQVQNTGVKLEDIKTNNDLIALYGNEINTINSDLQVFSTTPTANPVNSTAIQTLVSRQINKGVYLFLCSLATNNYGFGGRDFVAQLLLNNDVKCDTDQVLGPTDYSNYRYIGAILDVTQDNSTLTLRAYSTTTASYFVAASQCYLLKLKSSTTPASSMITSQKIDLLINLLENVPGSLYNYSTTEQAIGTWIDGKTIYRKVITYNGTMPSSTGGVNIPHGITNVETWVNVNCYVHASNGNTVYNVPWINSYNNSGYNIGLHVHATDIVLWCYGNFSNHTVHCILEYTKTS